MKTVLDAVNELTGDLSNTFRPLPETDKALYFCEDYRGWVCSESLSLANAGYICTVDRFNNYVTSLSHHAGKELFEQYLAADKTLLEKQVDYTSEESWKDAPEGAEYYNPSRLAERCKYYKTRQGDYYYFYDGVWVVSGLPTDVLKEQLLPRPQHKPIYTQEMYDAGGKVQVGMKFQDSKGLTSELLLPIDESGMGVAVFYGEYCIMCQSGMLPIDTRTDKEKACDAIWKELDDSDKEYDLRTVMELAYDKWVTNKP